MPESKPRKTANGKPVKMKPKGYTFTHAGKTYEMPDAQEAAKNVDNELLVDVMASGAKDKETQLRLVFSSFKAADIPDETRAAIMAMPQEKMLETIAEWFAFEGPKGVTAGE